MKKLIFVRHGKAEDGETDITDFERSLTVKGKVIAGEMALRFREKEGDPGLIITSPAFRAFETAMIFASEFGISAENIMLNSNLYLRMNFQSLLSILSGIDEHIVKITFFGHNPSFSETADMLSKDGCDIIPKTGVVCLSFNIRTWSEINHNKGKIEYFLKP